MEKEKQEQERIKKAWKHGTTTQKMMSFKIDLELVDYLNTKPNKGRYINELIAADMTKHQG